MLKLAFWVPLAACTYLALTPSPEDVVGDLSDVVAHVLAFVYLTFALWLAHYPASRGFEVMGWMLGYGVALEVVQSFLPARTADLMDVVVDAVGIVIGYLVYRSYALLRRVTRGEG